MDVDYPASHSMDSSWFAVDRDGHVAIFDSGEAGAVLVEAHGDQAPPSFLVQSLVGAVPESEVAYDLEARMVPGPRRGPLWHPAEGGLDFPTLVFLKSLDPIRQEIERGAAVPLAATGAEAVLFPRLTKALAERLHQQGHCQGCFFHTVAEEEVDPARLGLFVYGHLCENWISGPYGRERRPLRPIHLDQLPRPFRDLVSQAQFTSFCFAETLWIQPAEHGPCVSWEPAYLDVDGIHVHPLNSEGMGFGHAAERYAEFYTEFGGDQSELQFDPPSDPTAGAQ